MDFQALKKDVSSSPAFVLDETGIIRTLKNLDALRRQCGCKVLYSIKSLPFPPVMETAKPWVDGFSVSSLFEARLADEVLAGQGSIHLTTPGIRPDELDELSLLCSHISFNSLPQHQRFSATAKAQASIGLRLNPKLSFLHDDRFDPCRPHSKLGADIDELIRSTCLDQIQGLHVHNVFSATDFTPLIKTVEKLQAHLGERLTQLKWLNLGGGYLFDQIEDHRPFIDLVNKLNNDFSLEVYIEPGKAVTGRAGHLMATVLDSFVSDGKAIAVLDTSVNHNPEVFEYQRQPELHEHDPNGQYAAVLAGCTCLAGDVFGEYRFKEPLSVGDRVIFKNVGAYSLIKANRFNGYNLPDIYVSNSGGIKKLKHYTYQDYRRQWLAD
ncbi:MAG: carboxynorspermidine decarboxylase [Methylobacter sp.]|jgi:carboxynorspermidine decarboxylase